MNDRFTFCSSCILANNHKLPFVDYGTAYQSTFELVHSDLWGPSLIMSSNDHRYYVYFVDDYNKFTWI